MRVFWSWQSDRNQRLHHYFVRDVLKRVCKALASEPEFAEADRPEVDHDTKNALGTQDITSTILAKIAQANVFVADVTPIGKTMPKSLGAPTGTKPKHLQNPNVMSELGYAEHALGQDRILLVANAAHYPGPEALPFDWRHRSGAKTYTLPNDATSGEVAAELKRFAEMLTPIIRKMLLAQQPPPPPPKAIEWKAPSHIDTAIWDGQAITFRNSALGLPGQSMTLAEGPRIYVRVAPSVWDRREKQVLADVVVDAGLKMGGNGGDWGVNGAGAMSVWGYSGTVTRSATQWFQDTGEIWAVNASAFTSHQGRMNFSYQYVFQQLDAFLSGAVGAIRRVGGHGPFGIRLGATGMIDTVWPAESGWSAPDALGTSVEIAAQAETGAPDELRAALRLFWDEISDNYGLSKSPSAEAFDRAARLHILQSGG